VHSVQNSNNYVQLCGQIGSLIPSYRMHLVSSLSGRSTLQMAIRSLLVVHHILPIAIAYLQATKLFIVTPATKGGVVTTPPWISC